MHYGLTIPWQPLVIIPALALVFISYILFIIFRRSRVIIRLHEVYPPNDITSAEAGYVMDASIKPEDIASLILYWASKGYISISQTEEEEFMLTKLKELPPRRNKYEKYLFEQFFDQESTVSASGLNEKFHSSADIVKNFIIEHYSKRESRLFSTVSAGLCKLFPIASALLVWATLYFTVFNNVRSFVFALLLTLPGMLTINLPLAYLNDTIRLWNDLHTKKRYSRLILAIIISAAFLVGFALYMYAHQLPLTGLLISYSAAFIALCGAFLRKRTRFGAELLGKLLGLKSFLEKVEKSGIVHLTNHNPNYFYEILPYAYVFGITDKLADKFNNTTACPPDWYSSSISGSLTPAAFQLLLLKLMNKMTKQIGHTDEGIINRNRLAE